MIEVDIQFFCTAALSRNQGKKNIWTFYGTHFRVAVFQVLQSETHM